VIFTRVSAAIVHKFMSTVMQALQDYAFQIPLVSGFLQAYAEANAKQAAKVCTCCPHGQTVWRDRILKCSYQIVYISETAPFRDQTV
jgi:hypothetical protein